MTTPTYESQVVVTGQASTIKVSSPDALSGPQICEFSTYQLPDDSVESTSGLQPKATWIETLVFAKVPGGGNREIFWSASWLAGAESTKSDIPEQTHMVRAAVRKGTALIVAANEFRIPGFAVTELAEMHEIMVHEFSTQTQINSGLDNWTFYPAPLKKFISSLTPQQRSLLANCDTQRLIAFISLRGVKADHPICADTCVSTKRNRKSVMANADFSVFYCKKKGHRVTLECHTEYLCVNTQNYIAGGLDTGKFLANIWSSLAPNEKKPRKLFLAASAHENVVYLSLLNGHYPFTVTVDPKTGETRTVGLKESVMGGNYIHGTINTQGCWMLFRNYNWPSNWRDRFLSIYIRDARFLLPANGSIVIRKLASLGYDKLTNEILSPTNVDARSSSVKKWFWWDMNYAYNYFVERLLGIEFYSRAEPDLADEPNLYHTHGCTEKPDSLTLDERSFEKKHRAPYNANGFNLHENPQDRAIPDSVWGKNVRDFKTTTKWHTDFADCYIFNPDGLSFAKFMETPYKEPPDPVPLPPP